MENKELLPAETMSFLQLIEKYMILIPVIQRDYAQGRQTEDVNKIRKDFVHDLLSFIEDNTQPHHVDFVYGTVERKGGHLDAFIPLDGQQRLTTLFLLHVYVAGISGNYKSFYEIIKERFEYETRKSSTEFCRGLICHDVCGELLIKRKNNPQIKLSQIIENQGWFFSAWKQDPSVHGMLVMLDEIDKQIVTEEKSIPKLYTNLFKGHIPPIVFQWQPLDGYTLTDDLYIKMNARGLKLTDFEVFKALYEMSLGCVEHDIKSQFESKIDGEWCDFLWQQKGELKSTDVIMERILRLMIAFGCAGQDIMNKDDQNKLDKLFGRNKQRIQFSYSRYRELGVFHDTHQKFDQLSEETIKCEKAIARCVVEAFNVICNKNNSPLVKTTSCLPWCDEKMLISKILHNRIEDLTYEDFIYFYAYISFISRYNGNVEKELKQWIRYIFNLVNATNIDGSVQLSRIIRSIDAILNTLDKDVLSWISENLSVAAFSANQCYEESIKAKLILLGELNNKSEWKRIIYLDEQNSYMRGQIGFLLCIAGVYTSDIENIISSNEALDIFADCSEKARTLFSHFEKDDEITSCHLIERALLTKGMYLKYATAGRLNFCNHPYDRDNSWRKMLEITPGQSPSNGVITMKELLTDYWIDKNDAIKSLNTIINASIQIDDNWYSPFLGQYGEKLIDICHQGYIQKNDNYITLLHESQMNHYHSELLSRILHFELKPKYDFIHYCSVRSVEENPGVYFRIKINNIVFTIYMYYRNDWYLEVWDEHMYNYMGNIHDWDTYKEELGQILALNIDNDRVCIERQEISRILSSINKDIIVNS